MPICGEGPNWYLYHGSIGTCHLSTNKEEFYNRWANCIQPNTLNRWREQQQKEKAYEEKKKQEQIIGGKN